MVISIHLISIKNEKRVDLNVLKNSAASLTKAAHLLFQANHFCIFSLTSTVETWLIFFGKPLTKGMQNTETFLETLNQPFENRGFSEINRKGLNKKSQGNKKLRPLRSIAGVKKYFEQLRKITLIMTPLVGPKAFMYNLWRCVCKKKSYSKSPPGAKFRFSRFKYWRNSNIFC